MSEKKKVLLHISNLTQYFPIGKKQIGKEQLFVKANDGISLDIYEGETFGLAPPSQGQAPVPCTDPLHICSGEQTYSPWAGPKDAALRQESLPSVRQQGCPAGGWKRAGLPYTDEGSGSHRKSGLQAPFPPPVHST